ncbi:MAG: glycosyltransferase family 4 protein [Flavobacteriales bacterium]|jgi:glycosyltransferase involved in cell wall biosynthesis|nr:glycosyltransferase family 4 protein [Flavobacteriales bacterium]
MPERKAGSVMRTIGISHKTRYWQHYCFSNPPEGFRYERMVDIPWHIARIRVEFLANTKFFLPFAKADLYHTYNGVVANAHPWVIEVESYMPRYETMSPGNPLYKWALRRLAGPHCKALIFTSQSALHRNREHLLAAGVDPAKMSVIYRAVEQYEPRGRDADHFTIIFAGNGFFRKGGVELLKAFKRLGRPEARLLIISTLEVDWGVFPEPEVIAWAEKTIAEDPCITLYRRLPHEELIRHMRAADLFVSTTFQDPFNNTVLEAMGTGLPVICSDVGALPEVARDGRNGWVLPVANRTSEEIAEEITARMVQLMDDAELRVKMGAANAQIIADRFTLAKRNAALTKVYDAALGG